MQINVNFVCLFSYLFIYLSVYLSVCLSACLLLFHFHFAPTGGLFENGDEIVEMAFQDAVERINSDENIMPNTRLEVVIEKLERCDSFQASKRGMAFQFRRCSMWEQLKKKARFCIEKYCKVKYP